MRCYDGVPDSKLQARIDADRWIQDRLIELGLRATYFPSEGMWMVFDKDHKAVTGFHSTLAEAANAAVP